MTRVPQPGKTKTRLFSVISPKEAACLQRAFLEDMVRALSGLPGIDLVVAFTPPELDPQLPFVLPFPFRSTPQPPGDLSQRMHGLIERFLAGGYRKVALIGSDLPTLPPEYIQQAFSELDQADVVVGPARDGGYYLIGMTEPHAEVFEEIAWSTPEVWGQTIARVARAGLRAVVLPEWYDVDTPHDLAFLISHLSTQHASPGYCAATIRELERLGLWRIQSKI